MTNYGYNNRQRSSYLFARPFRFQRVLVVGWQLSHGERSRLYIARALLQGADLVVLDESLAALDPDSFRQALQCVLSRTSTLMLIAHP